MERSKIMEFIKSKDVEDLEEIKYKNDIMVVRFYYDFDEDELNGAKAYSDDECDGDEDVWYDEFFLPYLDDIAADNIGDIVEDCADEFSLGGQFVVYNIEREDYEYCEAICIFYEIGINPEISIDDVLDDLKL